MRFYGLLCAHIKSGHLGLDPLDRLVQVDMKQRGRLKTHGADYSNANLRQAAERMDSIPTDFTDLLELLEGVV